MKTSDATAQVHAKGRAGAKDLKSASDNTPSQREEIWQADTEQYDRRDGGQIGQDEWHNVETENEPELQRVCGYPVHPAAGLFPPLTDVELRALADDIAKNGQRQDIVRHPDGSILDGVNRLRACEIAGREPRITTWDGKPGEELAYVISQNVKRRHLNESQRGMIASKLAALPSGHRQAGKFAGVPTQAEAAEMMQVSERIVRSGRKVRQEAPANVARLVEKGRITMNAAEALVSRLSSGDKQRIAGMPDDDAEAEVNRVNKESLTKNTRTREEAVRQADAAQGPTVSAMIEPSANVTHDGDDDNRPIGAAAVSRALDRTGIKADTPARQAFVSAIECLPLSDAAWACKLASFATQEAGGKHI